MTNARSFSQMNYEKGYAAAKAEYELKWTKVEDGLPKTHKYNGVIYRERSDEVMCKIKDNDDVFNSFGYLVELANGHKEWRTDFMTDDSKVIAWMPIPEYDK